MHSGNDLKLFCLIVRTDIILVVWRSWMVCRAAPYKSLIVLYCRHMTQPTAS